MPHFINILISGVFAHGQGGYQFSKSPFIEKMQKIDPNAQIQDCFYFSQ